MTVTEEDLEVYLDDPAMCAGDLDGGPMWMRDCLGERFRLEPLWRMIARTISKASSNQINDRPIKTYRPSDRRQGIYPRAVGLQQSK